MLKFPYSPLQSPESAENRRLASIKRQADLSPEVKLVRSTKISESRKGKSSWNAGKAGYKLEWSEEAKTRRKEYGAWNSGIPASDEQKFKQSKTMKQKYNSGELQHWNLGGTVPVEVREKISKKCKEYKPTQEQKEKHLKSIRLRVSSPDYKSPMKGKKHTNETKQKISSNQIGENNHGRKKLREKIENICKAENLEYIFDSKTSHFNFTCKKCNFNFSFTRGYFSPSAIKLNHAVQNNICPSCYPRIKIKSKKEIAIFDFIKENYSNEIVSGTRCQIYPYEIDIFLPELKIGVEFNGLYWHSENVLGVEHARKEFNKYNLCKNKNILLINIFEDEWNQKQNIIKSKILHLINKTARKIHARKCELKIIGSETKNIFFKENSLFYDDVELNIGAFLKMNFCQ